MRTPVKRIWKAFGLEPHRSETFKRSTDQQFVEKMRDIVGLYLDPPERAVALCLDEKAQIQALDRNQPELPMPGQMERRRHDYFRHGTPSLFAALHAKTGSGYLQRNRQAFCLDQNRRPNPCKRGQRGRRGPDFVSELQL